jgi:phenylalanyl-tRNA synthetase alpha chain
MSTVDRIAALRAEAEQAIGAADSVAELEEQRVQWLGRKAELPNLLRGVAELAPEERGVVGREANQARQALEALIDGRAQELEAAELDAALVADRVDVTLPGTVPHGGVGRLHLLSATRREIEDVFIGLGFDVVEGFEVEAFSYNFTKLNTLDTHPSTAKTDTFYVQGRDDQVVLRTHTSPMQPRVMETTPPPVAVIIPGRVYRRDSDATHTPQFHQIEGLCVDEDVTLADLHGTLLAFARAVFGPERGIRMRPHFFPFTEPSVEVDVSCFQCTDGVLKDGRRCNLCRGSNWLEVLGAGMVDPNVFAAVGGDYDPDKVQGFAFGLGIERVAMLKHGVPDLRLFYDNDLRFLEQFG